jgi:tyrosine-specific transport protein
MFKIIMLNYIGKLKSKMKQILLLESIAVIVGTIIGAGVLGLPFAFAKAGFLTGLLVLGLISLCMTLTGLFLGEIALRTKDDHQLTGYTEIYLGKSAKHIQGLSLILGMYGALLAYTIGLGNILATALGGTALIWSIVIYFPLTALAFKGVAVLQRAELFITSFIILSLTLLILISSGEINVVNLQNFSANRLLLPYGAILFACSGLMAIPEAKEVLQEKNELRLLKRSIIMGNMVPAVIYLIFAMVVVGVTGLATTEIATIGLSQRIGSMALILGSVFAFFAMTSGFLALGTALTEVCEYDYKLSKIETLLIAFAPPLILFLLGIRDFFSVISLAGAFSVGISGILTVFVFWQAKKKGQRKAEYSLAPALAIPASVLVIMVFALGLIYTFTSIIQ